MNVKGADPVHKATIMPRGEALGVTWQIPEGPEKYSTNLYELKARLAVLMGGKAAEDIQFGADNVTAGCVSDLQQASSIARRMVMQFGMGGGSDNNVVAPIFMNENEYAYLSDTAKAHVDASVARLVSEAYATAHGILSANTKQLRNLSESLVEFETLSKAEIDLAVAGKAKEIRRRRAAEEKARNEEREKLKAAMQDNEVATVTEKNTS
jgi:ATP-dependent metalloprotease